MAFNKNQSRGCIMNTTFAISSFIRLFVFACAIVICHFNSIMVYAGTADYEIPEAISAKDIVPEEILQSDLYSIEDQVVTHGYTNTYRITSSYGNFTAHGNEMLLKLVQEIKAIHELDKIKKSKQFTEGLKEGAKLPFTFVKNLVTHPVSTVSGIPKGLWRYGSRVGEMATGDRSEYEDGVGKELILFSAQKRKLAYDLNVDVYSSNTVLQEYLNSVSWATYSGGIAVTAALRPLGPARFTKTAQTVNNLIRDNAPEDLNKINRKILKELNVDQNVVEGFEDNLWISPRHATVIVHSLQYMGIKEGASDFIQLVSTSESEEDAFFFQNIAELILHYLENTVEKEVSIIIKNNFALLKVRKHFVFPLLVDNGYWSEFGANLINTFETDIRSAYGIDTEILLWITGVVSERAEKELRKRNILVAEKAFKTVGEDI